MMYTSSDMGLQAGRIGIYAHVIPKPRGGSVSIRWDVENRDKNITYAAALILEVPVGLLVQTAGPITVMPGATGAIAFVHLVSGALSPGNVPCLLRMQGWLPANPGPTDKLIASHSFTLQVS
jgi:hypothetical protein